MSFFEKIKKFNAMYNMPEVGDNTEDQYNRLLKFQDILAEELNEVYDITNQPSGQPNEFIDKVAVADLLGDLIVYCASEAQRWNIPIEQVLDIIMESNFSKMGPDGKPIYDERGKLLKGPNYWKPESKIKELLEKK